MKRLPCLIIVSALILISGCARYETRIVPFKMPEAYHNVQAIDGAKVAAVAYDDSNAAQEAFGFDIRGAGLLPVQVVFDNQGSKSLLIGPHPYLYNRPGA